LWARVSGHTDKILKDFSLVAAYLVAPQTRKILKRVALMSTFNN